MSRLNVFFSDLGLLLLFLGTEPPLCISFNSEMLIVLLLLSLPNGFVVVSGALGFPMVVFFNPLSRCDISLGPFISGRIDRSGADGLASCH